MNEPPSTLEGRIRQLRLEAEALIDARAAALKAQSPHVPLAVLRNLLMNRTCCHCQAVLNNSADHDAWTNEATA
jgi:hypothetical protein